MLFLGLGEVILGTFTMVYPGTSVLLSELNPIECMTRKQT